MDETGLHRQAANHWPISPLSFLQRTAQVYPEYRAVVHGPHSMTWGELDVSARRLAAGLMARGIGKGDVVAILSPNTPAFVQAAFGVPLTGAVLLTLNTRLDPGTLGYCLEHGEAKMVVVDAELLPRLHDALGHMHYRPSVVRIDDPLGPSGGDADALFPDLFAADPAPHLLPDDEWQSFSLSYTSGTTGRPKGVVYSHRGVAMTAISNALDWALPHHPRYLWTLPMFHCMGWCFPYTIAMTAGANVCLRAVSADAMEAAFRDHDVSHFCGAPIVMQMAIEAAERLGGKSVKMMTAAAPPPAPVIQRAEAAGIHVTHVYGLTETYGPCVVSAWKQVWDGEDDDSRAKRKARQGVAYALQDRISVRDPDTMEETPRDGETIGEIMISGNIVMKGYLKDPAATETAFRGGMFHTGDLAVRHTDGYVEIKDRAKDIIISGGENISSIELEDALYAHPAVASAAVVAIPDEKWGERPCAFVELSADAEADEDELKAFVAGRVAGYKKLARIIFEPLPKTSTGKVQKFALRERARSL